MKKYQNVGQTDRNIRIILGILLLISAIFAFTGTLRVIAAIVGIIALATGTIRICPLYKVIDLSTNR